MLHWMKGLEDKKGKFQIKIYDATAYCPTPSEIQICIFQFS